MINLNVVADNPSHFLTQCLVVPVWQSKALDGPTSDLNAQLDGLIAEVRDRDGFKASLGETRVLYGAQGTQAARVVLVGLGKPEKASMARLRQAASKAARAVRVIRKPEFALVLPGLDSFSTSAIGAACAEGILLGLHLYNDLKTATDKPILMESATLLVPGEVEATKGAVELAVFAATGTLLARALVNLPSNLKDPEYLAETARQLAQDKGLTVQVWDEHRILQEKMGALYAVGMGSERPPRFIVLEYAPTGTETTPPIALVGKGMTFDTGGYSLKPSTSMEDMKDDMAGAAVVLGAMSALQEMRIQKRVIGVIASAENMVSGRAQRPGDIVTARNGKTIEVLNTDAEGRLILADALAWTSEQEPALIVDFATLTGAIGIALGQEAAGIFSNDESLTSQLVASGQETGERLWPFPMWDEYKEYVKGSICDLRNIASPDRRAGSIVGAVFLENFVGGNIPWAHLDIAAVAMVRDDRHLTARGATGFGVRLILNFLAR